MLLSFVNNLYNYKIEKENDSMLDKYDLFCKENPCEFSKEQLNKLKHALEHTQNGLVCDEMVDFMLWTQDLKSRQEYFAEYVARIYPQSTYSRLLEVGCGQHARLSKLLASKGYIMCAIDPKVENCTEYVKCIKNYFTCETSISEYDALIAQEPCEATEPMIRLCAKEKKDFIISLCANPHPYPNGTIPKSAAEWYDYLEKIDSDHSIIIYPNLIPGFVTPIMLGMYKK